MGGFLPTLLSPLAAFTITDDLECPVALMIEGNRISAGSSDADLVSLATRLEVSAGERGVVVDNVWAWLGVVRDELRDRRLDHSLALARTIIDACPAVALEVSAVEAVFDGYPEQGFFRGRVAHVDTLCGAVVLEVVCGTGVVQLADQFPELPEVGVMLEVSVRAGRAELIQQEPGFVIELGGRAALQGGAREILRELMRLAGTGVRDEDLAFHLRQVSLDVFQSPEALQQGQPFVLRGGTGQPLSLYVGSREFICPSVVGLESGVDAIVSCGTSFSDGWSAQ